LEEYVSKGGIKFAEPNPTETNAEPAAPASDPTTKYVFEVFGEVCTTDTLVDVLVLILRAIHKIDDNFFSRLSQESGRVRPILARSPLELYPGRPDLSRYSSEIEDGWYIGTNYSKRDVARILGVICKIANLNMGDDISGPAIDDIKLLV
jgi:hypothetical protein